MKKLLAAVALSAGLIVANAAAANIVVNGDFSAGNTGFTSGYSFVSYGTDMHPEGLYTVGANPFSVHSSWINIDDNNNRLIVNGATSTPLPFVWREDIENVTAGTYKYAFNAANICCNQSYTGPNLASLLTFEFSSDGGNTFTTIDSFVTNPPGDAGQFTILTGTFNVATDGVLRLNIGSGNDFAGGNDFAIDNISVSAAVPEPMTWMLMIGGFGLAGAMLRRRRTLSFS